MDDKDRLDALNHEVDDEMELHEHEHDHEHDHDELVLNDILPEDIEEYTIVMADEETGEEFTFYMADDFEYEGNVYVVLLSMDEDPEAVFAKVVDMGDDTEGFETLDDEEFERVSDYYIELCEAEQEDEYEDVLEVEELED